MKYRLFFMMYFLYSICSYGQKETNIWYFGNGAGLDFKDGAPVTMSYTQLNTMEGCASISKQDGKLLFYTDGVTIWNHLHQVMVNGTGLQGDKSSTQSAVIVPMPENEDLFYVFTADNVPGLDGVRYSIVDMGQEQGLGSVIEKNVLLYAPVTEKLTAVKHRNNKDIWVLAHGYNSNAFYAYLLTASGVANATKPVTSTSGTVHNGNITNNAIGYMKASPDGRKLALGVRGMKLYELVDFDNATGIVSNPVTFQSAEYNNAYGLEFSPDGTKLYINSSQNPTAKIYQIDLANSNKTSLIGTSQSPYAGSLQLGPDGKIYFARYQSKHLGIIHNPDAAGGNCNYEDNGIYLDGKTSTFGLPNFIQSYFYQPLFTYRNTCFGGPTTFTITDTTDVQKVEWIFDDPVIGINNMANKISPQHLFSKPGDYEVSLTITYYDGTTRKAMRNVTIKLAPEINLGNDTLLCADATLQLNAASLGSTYYKWQDGSTQPTFTVTGPGKYWAEVAIGDCIITDSISVAYKPALQVDLGKDTTVYKTNSLLLTVSQPGVTCLWQDGSTENTYKASLSGTYQVQVTNGCETTTDEITIRFVPALTLNLGPDKIICTGETIILGARQAEATYLWQDSSTQDHFTVQKPGMYWVEVSNTFEKLRDSVVIAYRQLPDINLGSDTVIAPGAKVTYDFTTSQHSLIWQDGSRTNRYTIDKPGIYWVQASNTCGTIRDSVIVSYAVGVPDLDLGKDITLCEGEVFTLKVNALLSNVEWQNNLRWQNGSTAQTFTVSQAGTYWVESRSSFGVIRDSVQVTYQSLPKVDLGTYLTLCGNEQLILNASQPSGDATYRWQDGSTEPELTVSIPGTYWVEVSNACGTVRNSVEVACPACVTAAMPNVITPNGDSANDSFIIPCANQQTWAIEIYNRWGKMVFHSKAYQGEWSAEHQDNGIYFYTLTNTTSRTTLKGVVHVLR